MNQSLVIAAALAFILGAAHSVIGEYLIFRRLRARNPSEEYSDPVLKNRQVRALWSTWHLLTIFGWGFGAVLLHLARPGADTGTITQILAAVFLVSGIFWALGTHGKHPAWVVLLLIAGVIWWA